MHDDFEHVPDEALLATVRRLTARSNVALADLLAHLGEVERRGIHRERACASLYTYCIYELRMSEDAAYRRAKAARLVRRYPEVREAIAKGEIHLTGVLMIAPYLGGEHHQEVLRRSRFRSKRELCRLVAELDPKPAVPARVEPIGPAPAGPASYTAYVESLTGAVRDLPEGSRPEDWIDESEPATHEAQSGEARSDEARVASDASSSGVDRPLRYKVQFTASQEYVDLLEEAVALLGHERPRPALPDVQLRALELLVAKLRKERLGGPREPKANACERGTASARVLPALDEGRPDRAAPARGLPEHDERGPHRAAPARVLPAGDERPPRGHESHGRYVPRSVRRIVRVRDGARCAYADDRGVRCRETTGLELHHRQAHALGGPNTAGNLELRCQAHNTLAAEADFGREHMDRVRPRACPAET